MKNKIIIPGVLFAVVAIFSIIIIVQNNNHAEQPAIQSSDNIKTEDQGIVLFYGDGCPHCEIVEKYVTENNIESIVSFAKKEVYYNKQNSAELVEKAESCGMPTDSIGVPFLWDGSKCHVGDHDIIEFFKLKTNIQ
ncbi:MAG: hypothetical protein PHH17_02855 [Candidatus Pacebacteria bacterium]|nr:hypothetical protein [Candidatus Parcubacteria bacterium]MDD3072743.1 hypothetical protein [Candidatus Paceibacterota bacterium]MDD3729350.1 hypothetical protein [Candidatus Paceibacterota bacterium]MDD4201525.1 hypothetical protein [Candidatus Paceibacterota bacterium]MDD5446115.1 hypothetical protein [Candidatus Paceibacterota bacterium]